MRSPAKEVIDLLEQGYKLSIAKREASKKHKLTGLITNIQILNHLTEKERNKYQAKLITKPVRTSSGVAPVAIMTSPIECPHAKTTGPCTMCPGGPKSNFGNVPQSYTGAEPATRRALRANFDPYLQVFNRLEQFIAIGQLPEKVELIIMGGTFPARTINYQDTFVKYAFKAMNDFSKIFFTKNKLNLEKFKTFFELPGDIQDEARVKKVITKIKKLKKTCILEKEQKRNEKSNIKCIGLVIETRPDYANLKEANQMLKLGCTRVELGVQSTNNKVLTKIKRGHSIEDSIKSTKILKDLGFKINYHMMIGLPKSNKKQDINQFKELFSNEYLKPDMLKIYPCLVTKGTELYNDRRFKPLTAKKAAKIVAEIKKDIPPYVRIMRIQRDIPHTQIARGPNVTNLRQEVEKVMKKNKYSCNCIRCREIKLPAKDHSIKILAYEASEGVEFFIEAHDKNKIIGFCRLRFPNQTLKKEITKDSALIRELHVYGDSASIGKTGKIQHKGIGKELIKLAEKISKENNKNKMIIISGIGVRNYYKKLGYKLNGPYMSKKL
jgi:elongator complex protein 3